MIELAEAAGADGLDVQFDAHTRLHGITNLSASLPQWALEGGPADLAARLRDPAARRRLKRYQSIISSFGLGGWDRVFLFASDGSPEGAGRSLADLTPPGGDVFDTIYDLLLAEGDDPHPALVISTATRRTCWPRSSAILYARRSRIQTRIWRVFRVLPGQRGCGCDVFPLHWRCGGLNRPGFAGECFT